MRNYPYYMITYQLGSDYDEDTDTNIRFRYVGCDTRQQLLELLELLEYSRAIYIDITYFAGSKLKCQFRDR